MQQPERLPSPLTSLLFSHTHIHAILLQAYLRNLRFPVGKGETVTRQTITPRARRRQGQKLGCMTASLDVRPHLTWLLCMTVGTSDVPTASWKLQHPAEPKKKKEEKKKWEYQDSTILLSISIACLRPVYIYTRGHYVSSDPPPPPLSNNTQKPASQTKP